VQGQLRAYGVASLQREPAPRGRRTVSLDAHPGNERRGVPRFTEGWVETEVEGELRVIGKVASSAPCRKVAQLLLGFGVRILYADPIRAPIEVEHVTRANMFRLTP
jgi:hypothetical protein